MKSDTRIILLDKPEGTTSFRSLGEIRKTVSRKTGHTGTLDKFASGLMIVLTGQFTKLNPVFSSMDKSYLAEIVFGFETDTLDPEGEVIHEGGRIPSLDEIEKAVREQFTGRIMQAPPIYSALHVGGKRAYELARSGRDVEMEKRPVEIYSFETVSFRDDVYTCRIHVSKGTYIRSIARDLAYALGTYGHLVNLRRETVGPFTLEDVNDDVPPQELLERLGVGTLEIREENLFAFRNGRRFSLDTFDMKEKGKGDFYMMTHKGNLVAVARFDGTYLKDVIVNNLDI